MGDTRFEWRLQEVMRAVDIFQNAELQRRLAADGIDLSSSQVHRLVTEVPERLNLNVLAALCRILDAEPGDLIRVDLTDSAQSETTAAAARSVNVVDLAAEIRPRRARITRD